MSAKLKLLGVSVGSIGDAHGRTPGSHSYVFQDDQAGVYKKIVVSGTTADCSAPCWWVTWKITATCCR